MDFFLRQHGNKTVRLLHTNASRFGPGKIHLVAKRLGVLGEETACGTRCYAASIKGRKDDVTCKLCQGLLKESDKSSQEEPNKETSMSASTKAAKALNESLVFAVLLNKSIENKSGRATGELFRILQLNGCTWKVPNSLTRFMQDNAICFVRDMTGRRTYKIELVSVPTQYSDLALELSEKIVWKAIDTGVSAQSVGEEVVVAAAATTITTDTPSADEIAHAILDRVFAKYLEVDETPSLKLEKENKELRHQLGQAWDQREAAVSKAEEREEQLSKAVKLMKEYDTRIRTLNAELEQVRANLAKALKAQNTFASEAAQRALDDVMRQRPSTTKGSD